MSSKTETFLHEFYLRFINKYKCGHKINSAIFMINCDNQGRVVCDQDNEEFRFRTLEPEQPIIVIPKLPGEYEKEYYYREIEKPENFML